MMKKYSDRLKDPRWQKKRLEIFQRDEWTCRDCFSKDQTLVIHHLLYEKGKDPWDYENDCLVTLCEGCHEHAHESRHEYEESLLDMLRRRNYSITDLMTLTGDIENYRVKAYFCP